MGFITLVLIVVAVIVITMFSVAAEKKKVAAMPPAERQRYLEEKQASLQASLLTLKHGPMNQAMICPHCGEKGRIRTKPVERKKGISGGKATAAILTGGVSMLATGLSRKEHATNAHCGNCGNTWEF